MAAPAERTQVDVILRPIIRGLHVIGFPLENLDFWTSIWWYYLVISSLVWIVLFCCSSVDVTTIEDVCDIVINVSWVIQILGALLTVRIFRTIILETTDNMQKEFWFHDNELDTTIHKMIYRILPSICLVYVALCHIALGIFGLEPLIHGNGKFTLDMRFPYRNIIKESPYYTIVYVMQIVTVVLGTSCLSFLDSLYIASMGFVLIQVDVIKQKLKMLTSGNDGEIEMYEKLKTCVAHHNVVLRSLEKIEETYRYNMLDKLLTDMACLSVTTYLFSQQTSINFKFLIIFGVCGSQPLMYCFFGEFVTSECASIGEEAYEVTWETFGYKSVTSALSTMIQRSQKPVYMTAGGMVMFSLPNYVAFMRMMVSFYLVLKPQ